jgi:hypothetical protein
MGQAQKSQEPPTSGSSKVAEFTGQQKVKAALRVLQGESVDAVGADLGVSRERVQRWSDRFIEGGREAILRREDRAATKSKKRRVVLQWASLVAVLLIVLFFLTRFLMNQGPPGGD